MIDLVGTADRPLDGGEAVRWKLDVDRGELTDGMERWRTYTSCIDYQ